ncbi:hypothetical protein Ahia01_000306600 [Argonauta hians]
MPLKKFQFTSMKKKSKNNEKTANQIRQPTLFQTWGSKNTVSNPPSTTATSTTSVPNTSNYNGDVNNDDNIVIVSDDDDLLLQALEYDESLSATKGTVQSNDGGGGGVAEIEPNWDINLDNIPDLPGFDKFAGRLWIYPTNYPVREYQYNIVKEALFTNTLVVLPTGLGKTFIAAVVMFNFYRWYPSGIVLFLAPTKPLVAQQIEACYNIMGIPQSDMTEMTGKQNPASRRQMWEEKRILFLTPQVLMNDLTRGTCIAARIKCVVLDEAHKSLGNYAYCQVVREVMKQNPDFRVLALSATPGNTLKSVQEVLTNLMISAVAIRTEECPDVKKYSNERKIETIVVPLGPVIEDIQKKYVEILESIVNRLVTQKLLFNVKAQTVSKFSVLKARDAFRRSPPQNLSPSAMGRIEGDFGLLITLCHGHELLQLHGLRSFYQYISNMVDSTSSRSRQELFRNPVFVEIYEKLRTDYEQNVSFTQMSSQQRSVPYAVGHPKLEKLLEIVVNHFKSFKEENGDLETRVMIFSQYRNSVTDIAELLKRERPLVRAMSFVGQSTGKNTKGLTQKEQIKVMKDFRDGGYNTLIATCVGEEGLDIGEVDLIVCFDTCKSPIRLVQRMGRTGRKREGRIIMLVTKGREEQMYKQAKYQWNSINRSLKEGCGKLAFNSHQPKMIPEGLQPRCLKVDIVVSETFRSVHQPKQKKPKKILKKTKKTTAASPLTRDILQFTSPGVSLLDTLPQPSTSKSGKEDTTDRAMNERRFSRLSSDEESEIPDPGLKEILFSKKAGKDTRKSGGKKNKKKKTETKDQVEMEKSPDFLESCLKFSDSNILPDLEPKPEMSKEGPDSINQMPPDDDGNGGGGGGGGCGGGDGGKLSPVVSLKPNQGLSQTSSRNAKSSSVVPAAPDTRDISKSIDNFHGLLSSMQPHELNVGSLAKDWDTEFATLSNTLQTSNTSPRKILSTPVANISRKQKLEDDDDGDGTAVDGDGTAVIAAAGDDDDGTAVITGDDDDGSARNKGGSGLAPSTVDVQIEDPVRPDVLKIAAKPSLLSVAKAQSNYDLFDVDDFLSDSSFEMNNDFDPVPPVKLTDAAKAGPEMKPEITNRDASVSKAGYSSSTSVISGPSCSRVGTPSPVDKIKMGIRPSTATIPAKMTGDTSDTFSPSSSVWLSDGSSTISPDKINTEVCPTIIISKTSISSLSSKTASPANRTNTGSPAINTCNMIGLTVSDAKTNSSSSSIKTTSRDCNITHRATTSGSLSVSTQPPSRSHLESPGGKIVVEEERARETDGICFDFSADLFSDEYDFTGLTEEINNDGDINNNNNDSSISHKGQTQTVSGKETGAGCSAGNVSSLSSKLSSLINSHATVKDSFSKQHLEDSLNFDLEFGIDDGDDVFPLVDRAGQNLNLHIIDDPVVFDLQFDSHDFNDGLTIPEEKSGPSSANLASKKAPQQSMNSSINSDSRRNLGSNTTATTSITTPSVIDDDDEDDDDDDVMFVKRKSKAAISPSSDGSTPLSKVKGYQPSQGFRCSDSPVTTRRKPLADRGLQRRRRLIDDDEDDDDDNDSVFEEGRASRLEKGWLTTKISTPKPVVVSRPKRRKISKRGVTQGHQFLDVEAEVSGSDDDDEEEEEAVNGTEDHYEHSFIDDDYTAGNTEVDMTTVYLKSVVSPVCKPRGYKLQHSHYASDVYSQSSEPDLDCYEPDSFLDDSEIPMDDCIFVNATQEIVSEAQGRPKPKGPAKRRVVWHMPSSSEEEEEIGKRGNNMEPPQTGVQKKRESKGTEQHLSKDSTSSSVSYKGSAGESASSSLQHLMGILADSRTISGAQEILSNVKSKYNIPVEVVKLKAADYAVSDRTGVVRMYLSDAFNVTNSHKLTDRLQQLTNLYDRPCLIIEKDPVKKGLASIKTPFHQTKYYEKLLSRIGYSPTRLLFSDNKDETCTLLAKLFFQEKAKGFAIEDPRLNGKQEKKLKFLLTFPELDYALALKLCKNFASMGELLSSRPAEIAYKGNMSEHRADLVYQYIHKEPCNEL